MSLLPRRDFMLLEHEREGRFQDKIRADGRSVFYDCYLRGESRKLELLEPEPERWDAFWVEIDRLQVVDWTEDADDKEEEEYWSLRLRRSGRKIGLTGSSSPPAELLLAVSTLLGRQLASARAALLPEPADDDASDEPSV